MKVVEIGEMRGVDSLRVAERPVPQPGIGEVVLKMRAFSLNYRDLLVIDGVGRWRPALPRIPLSDGVGIVHAIGQGVSRFKIGDRVAPIFYPKWLDGGPAPEKMSRPPGGAVADGVLAECTLFEQSALVPVPPHLSDEEAATLPCAAVTAWNAVMNGQIVPGKTVVVLGTGGVSLFALQFAKALGARVIVTSSSDEKLERAKRMGAAAGINYRVNSDWPRAVLELTGGVGADCVVDTAGDLKQAIAAVRLGGTVAFVGLLTGMSSNIDLVALMGKSACIKAVDVGSREMFLMMNQMIAVHNIHPMVDRVFGFTEAADAVRYLKEARHFGKICLLA